MKMLKYSKVNGKYRYIIVYFDKNDERTEEWKGRVYFYDQTSREAEHNVDDSRSTIQHSQNFPYQEFFVLYGTISCF